MNLIVVQLFNNFPAFCGTKWLINAEKIQKITQNFMLCTTLKFLCAFAKLRKATASFLMLIRLSAWNNSAPTGWTFMRFGI